MIQIQLFKDNVKDLLKVTGARVEDPAAFFGGFSY